ncbi:hypothetical protein Syun_028329 [Stephania yunnanensis]|uniref:Uncharacterized protein n=1 Tax=Stephania yunnanensis TaxID=152371 RepID=A0AAP0HLT7_9MAGN
MNAGSSSSIPKSASSLCPHSSSPISSSTSPSNPNHRTRELASQQITSRWRPCSEPCPLLRSLAERPFGCTPATA